MYNFLNILIVLILFSSFSSSENADPCYYITHLELGLTGNCIPEAACTNNVTAPHTCPSYPADHTCCFNLQFPGREVRGAWVATVDHIDWPGFPVSQNVTVQQTELRQLFDNLELAGINTIYFQVRPMGDALYSSDIEPWSRFLTGTQGQPPSTFWDPLEYAIEYAHGKNMELHAWINPYRANIAPTFSGLAPNHMAIQFPQYAYIFGTYVWMEPGAEVVQNRTYDVSIDLVTRYDLDGLHMDDYFYPYPVSGVAFPDDPVYNEYLQNGGTLAKDDWRRDNVNKLVERLNVGIHQVKPWVKFSISPFGIYRPCHEEGMPCSITGLDQYSAIYSDPKLWLQNGWVDVLQPQLYWKIDPPQQSYPVLLDWWVAQNSMNRHVYAGNFLSRVLEGWDISEITNQVVISRETSNRQRGSWGNVQFSAKIFNGNVQDAIQHFRSRVYQFPALQPNFHWLADAANVKSPPAPLQITKTTQNELQWNTKVESSAHKVVIYKQYPESWQIVKILNFEHEKINLSESGAYAISALDRFGQESQKTFFNL